MGTGRWPASQIKSVGPAQALQYPGGDRDYSLLELTTQFTRPPMGFARFWGPVAPRRHARAPRATRPALGTTQARRDVGGDQGGRVAAAPAAEDGVKSRGYQFLNLRHILSRQSGT